MTYPLANTTVQWFYTQFRNSSYGDVEKVVWHSTEGHPWPPYDGGSKAPHYTVNANFEKKKLEWRAHFPDGVFSRALRNEPGGVQTNLDGALQVEIIGTCDPGAKWPKSATLKMWDLPDWVIDGLADFFIWCLEEHGVPFVAPAFKAYPASAGKDNGVRFTGRQWDSFRGHCGHQHVPENVHGDTGAFPIGKIIERAKQKLAIKKEAEMAGMLDERIELSAAAARNLNGVNPVKPGDPPKFKEGDMIKFEYFALWGSVASQEAAAAAQAAQAEVAELTKRVAALEAKNA